MPDEQEPVLNKQAALELCDDDEELFLEIVVAYLEDAIEHGFDPARLEFFLTGV